MHEVVLLKHLAPGWALIQVNLDPIQEVGPKVGGWRCFLSWCSIARLPYKDYSIFFCSNSYVHSGVGRCSDKGGFIKRGGWVRTKHEAQGVAERRTRGKEMHPTLAVS